MPLFSKLPFAFPAAEEEIINKRAFILRELQQYDEGFQATPVRQIKPATLARMCSLYDKLFLNGYIAKKYATFDVTLSSRLISSAGKFLCTKGAFGRLKEAEIRMSGDFLYRLDQGPFELNGLCVASPQEAFLVVFEHELCHAIEMGLYGKTGHSARFLTLAHGLFAHTATRHKLPTRKHDAQKCGLAVGIEARFPYGDQALTGVVTYIGKTATVMVADPQGAYRDRKKRRYTKYRVPLSKLTPL